MSDRTTEPHEPSVEAMRLWASHVGYPDLRGTRTEKWLNDECQAGRWKCEKLADLAKGDAR